MPKKERRELFSDPTLLTAMFDYLLTVGKITTDNFVGDSGIITNSGHTLKLAIHRDVMIIIVNKSLYMIMNKDLRS